MGWVRSKSGPRQEEQLAQLLLVELRHQLAARQVGVEHARVLLDVARLHRALALHLDAPHLDRVLELVRLGVVARGRGRPRATLASGSWS